MGLRRAQCSRIPTWAKLYRQTSTMKAAETITNSHTDDLERAREFFGALGLTEDGMSQGFRNRYRARQTRRTP